MRRVCGGWCAVHGRAGRVQGEDEIQPGLWQGIRGRVASRTLLRPKLLELLDAVCHVERPLPVPPDLLGRLVHVTSEQFRRRRRRRRDNDGTEGGAQARKADGEVYCAHTRSTRRISSAGR